MSFADELKSVRLRKTQPPSNVSNNEPLLCPDSETYRKLMDDTQFERYYRSIERWTFPSVIVPLNAEEIKALHEGHHAFKNSSEQDDDRKTEACFQLFPVLLTLSKTIDDCDLKRPIFVRLSTRSPKDAGLLLNRDRLKEICRARYECLGEHGVAQHNLTEDNRRRMAIDEASIRLLAVNDGFHAVQLLLASQRIQDDLQCSSLLNLIIREFLIDDRRYPSEFRAFIYRRQFTALTQYNEFVFYPTLHERKDAILRSIERFFHNENLLQEIPFENCALDLLLIEQSIDDYRVYICEINPLAEFAGAGLFSWLNDRDILLGRQPFQFRINEKDPTPNQTFQMNNDWFSLIDQI